MNISSHENSKHDRNFSDYSIAYFTIRFYVISQINTCIEFRFVRFCNFYIDAWFRSRHITLRKFARKFQTTYRWESRIVEKIISLKKFVLKKFQNSSLKKFARKFQTEFVKIQSKWHKRLLWKNVENTIFANVLQSKFNWYNLTKTKLMRFCWN